jgi:UPF0176 protein
MGMATRTLNISTYRFVTLDGLPALRQRLEDEASQRELKGTVLLAPEGINLFLAGPADAVYGWLHAAGLADDRLRGLPPKESWTAEQPFKRLKVKIKPEIIRMNMPAIRPDGAPRAPAVSPRTLARWLANGRDDAGRPVLMLDTRNGFEVDAGAFDGAIDWRLDKFSDFPAALTAHRAQFAGKTVVSYCTGGIRCEKAALVMQQAGIESSYQLEGGILKYFEETEGAPHWRGDCFVFDERRTLAPDLRPTTAALHTDLTDATREATA